MQLQWKREWTAPSLIGVVSFGLGVGAGYILHQRLNKRLESQNKYQHVEEVDANELIQRAEAMIQRLIDHTENKEQVNISIDEDKIDAPIDQEIEIIVVEDEDGEWDWTTELAKREGRLKDTEPYILHVDEFINQEKEFSQSTLSYYKGDNILCDELNVPIYNYQKVVGELIFGHGSKDPSIVYIRNEYLEAEYEVILDEGYFQVEVLGQEVEDNLSHNKQSIRKFRMD